MSDHHRECHQCGMPLTIPTREPCLCDSCCVANRYEERIEKLESWRLAANAWQSWATTLLDELGRQPLHGQHGDEAARSVIESLAMLAPGVPRCSRCGCFSTRHEVDDEELRECADCECTQFESGGTR